jgi:hypothetical protein
MVGDSRCRRAGIEGADVVRLGDQYIDRGTAGLVGGHNK